MFFFSSDCLLFNKYDLNIKGRYVGYFVDQPATVRGNVYSDDKVNGMRSVALGRRIDWEVEA